MPSRRRNNISKLHKSAITRPSPSPVTIPKRPSKMELWESLISRNSRCPSSVVCMHETLAVLIQDSSCAELQGAHQQTLRFESPTIKGWHKPPPLYIPYGDITADSANNPTPAVRLHRSHLWRKYPCLSYSRLYRRYPGAPTGYRQQSGIENRRQ